MRICPTSFVKSLAVPLLFLTASCNTAPPPAQPSTEFGGQAAFDVRAFGAVGDGDHLDSPAINNAIDACYDAGGGTVYLPAGVYLSGSIRLQSDVSLFLDSGAVILGAPQKGKPYDKGEMFHDHAYQDPGHTHFHNSLIWGEDLTNISIVGRGMIKGGDLVTNDNGTLGNKSISLKGCRNVLIRDITIAHGGWFAILTTGCDVLTIDNVTIDTNRDGIDLDCCRNTTVSNCRVNSPNDDAIVPKSTLAMDHPFTTENLTITNCQVSGYTEGTLLDGTLQGRGGTGRIKLGTESNGGFRNITISNCTFRRCRGLALEEVDGGVLENVTISNLSMMDINSYAIFIRLGDRNRGPEDTRIGAVRNVLISNVVAKPVDRKAGILIMGIPGHPVDRVRLDNIRIECTGGGTDVDAQTIPPELADGYPEPYKFGKFPAWGLFARHVTNLELSNVRLELEKKDARSPFIGTDIQNMDIDNFKCSQQPGIPAAQFQDVWNVVVRDSPALSAEMGDPVTATTKPTTLPSTEPEGGEDGS
jgi:polygalacturonase